MPKQICPSCNELRSLSNYRGEDICTSCRFIRRACLSDRAVVVDNLVMYGSVPAELKPLWKEIKWLKTIRDGLRYQLAVKQLEASLHKGRMGLA